MSATHIVSIGFALDARECEPADIAAQVAILIGREFAPFLVGDAVSNVYAVEDVPRK